MKRYRFRLEQVRRVRRVQAEMAAADFAVAQRAEADAAHLEAARELSIADRARLAGEITTGVMWAQRAVWDAELRVLEAARAGHRDATAVKEAELGKYLDASRRERALDLLDERRREEHRIEADRSEAARIDDIVGARFARRDGNRR